MFEKLGYEKHEDFISNIGCFYNKEVSHYIYNKYPKIIIGFIGKAKDFNIENFIISGIINKKEESHE